MPSPWASRMSADLAEAASNAAAITPNPEQRSSSDLKEASSVRHLSRLCQTCFSLARPGDYFPESPSDGVCCGCGDDTFVARVSRGEAQQVAYSLFGSPEDRPACCRVEL